MILQSIRFEEVLSKQIEASKMEIHDFSASAVEAMLSFIYNGEIREDGAAMENFLIADKFRIEKMKSAYEKILSDQVNNVNAFDMFVLSLRYSAENLKKEAFAKIASKFGEDLPPELMGNPDLLKRIIDNRQEYENLLAQAK